MTDPKAYATPIAFTMPMKLQADTELLESVCENNTSLARMTKLTDYDGRGKEPLIAVSPTQFLWSGTYVEFPAPGNVVFHYAEGSERGPRRR